MCFILFLVCKTLIYGIPESPCIAFFRFFLCASEALSSSFKKSFLFLVHFSERKSCVLPTNQDTLRIFSKTPGAVRLLNRKKGTFDVIYYRSTWRIQKTAQFIVFLQKLLSVFLSNVFFLTASFQKCNCKKIRSVNARYRTLPLSYRGFINSTKIRSFLSVRIVRHDADLIGLRNIQVTCQNVFRSFLSVHFFLRPLSNYSRRSPRV